MARVAAFLHDLARPRPARRIGSSLEVHRGRRIMNALSAGGIAARFGAALVLILATYNPEGRSYFDWVVPRLPEFDALRAFVGIVLLIGWTVFLRASTRSLGVLGFVLAAAFFGTLIWLGIDYGVIARDNPRVITYVAIVALAAVLTAGMVWSIVRRGLTGQADVDDVDA